MANEPNVIIVVFNPAEHECFECEGVFSDADGDNRRPILFNYDCEEDGHGFHTVVFHYECMPENIRQMYLAQQRAEAARWN